MSKIFSWFHTMDFLSFFSWLIFFIFLFAVVLRNFIKPAYSHLSESERRLLKDAIGLINLSWDTRTLKQNLLMQIQRLPKCRNELTQAANKQQQLLQAFYAGNRFADMRVKTTIFAYLQNCKTAATYQALESIFAPLIAHSPSIARMFEQHRKRSALKIKSALPKAKNLFAKCTNLDEVKQRFRRLAFLNHPDRGGKEAAMREVLRQYQEAVDTFQN